MADGFHIDGDGNLWIGSTSTNFDNSAAFYVKTDGEMKATSGEIGGLDIESSRIKSSSYSNTNSEGFQIHSDGTAKFYGSLTANSLSASGANISGNITATDGTIGGTQINSSNIESTTFNNTTGYQIGANSATFHDVTVTGTISGANIDGTVSGTLATANSGTRVELSSGNDAGFIRYFTGNQQTGTIGSDSSGLSLDAGTAQYITLASATGIKSFGPWFYWDGSAYSNDNTGNKVVRSDSNGQPYWGNVPANAGVTALAINSNMLAVNDNVGSVVLSDNHTTNHHASSDHTGNGNTNLATVGYVNSRGFTGNNGNSNLSNANVDQSHGPHGNGNHNHSGTVLTTAGAGNLYAVPHHGHNNYANASHAHNYYAMNGHTHGSGGATINAFMHDDRFLNINANTVPGLNVVNKLNPVTANFSKAYLQGMKDGQDDKSVRDSMSSMHKNTFRLTVQDVEQALLDDGVDTDEVAWLVDRLHYVDPWIANESEEKKEHGSRGLLNGELEAVLVQAIKDLSAKIDTLEDRLSTLEG